MSWTAESVDELINWAVGLWNLIGLPALLAGVVVVALVGLRRGGDRSWADRRHLVRILGLIHYGFALWSLTVVVAEVWAYRTMGVFPTNPATGLHGSLLAITLDVPIGLGLRRYWRLARWAAILLAGLRMAIAGMVVWYIGKFGVVFDVYEWPRFAVARVLPLFMLGVLLLPGTARLFRGAGRENETAPGSRDLALALLARLFLIMLGSVVLTDALDWALRTLVEITGSAGS